MFCNILIAVVISTLLSTILARVWADAERQSKQIKKAQ